MTTPLPLQQIVLAGPRGFCAGVDRAIDIVELALQVCPPPVYVRKEIVHNRHVVEALRAKGALFVDELDEVPDDATVIFSAHGISPAVRAGGPAARAARDRRHVPARDQGAPRGRPLRARGLLASSWSATPTTTRSWAPWARRRTACS